MKNKRYPEVIDTNGKLIAILDKAYSIGYTEVKNGLWTCSFKLPLNDSKSNLVQPKYHIVIYDYETRIGRFIVNPKRTIKDESTREISFECEHVLALLHNSVLFQYHQLTNNTTSQVLEYLLSNQSEQNWQLGTVEFTRYFSYSWENERSLLNPIMGITEPFDVPYLWTWDDSSYPFVLNLVVPFDEVKDMIVAGKNLKGISLEQEPTNLVTRIYPLGFGEGVNQLNIKKVNGGIPYVNDPAAEALYDIHEDIWIDKRFEDADTLKANALALLEKSKQPIETCEIQAIDYTLKDKYNFERYTTGDVLKIFNEDTSTNTELRIEKLSKPDVYGQPDNISLELGNKVPDIGMTISDLQKKQLVNDTYSQGATNIDSRDFQDNCDPNFPVVIRFPIPDDVVNINEMKLTFETLPFRAFSRAIKGGGGTTKTSSSGGGSTQTSSSGGGTTVSSSGGGGTTATSSAGGDHDHIMFANLFSGTVAATARPFEAGGATVELKSTGDTIRTWTSSGNHSHSVTISSHTHSVTIANHTHTITVPNHTHDIVLLDHTHEIDYGIYEFGSLPTSLTVKVDGATVPITGISGEDIDLIPYLLKDTDGKISRGRYAEIVITPNNLARINATVTSRLFIQSRIGGTY
ncbi:MAG: phage tail spike protein [Planococcaceae bacterium]|nr:phage tail spike protein [Planococcaceae bacterium]